MLDPGEALRLVGIGTVALVGLGACLAWLPATRRDPAGLPARLFLTAGAIGVVADFGRLGSVLGLALAGMGAIVWWEGLPEPEVPRPRLLGLVVGAVATAAACFVVLAGWGPLGRLPDEVRPVAGLAVAGAGVLATLAVADRARVQLREALRRRFDEPRSAGLEFR